MAPHVAEQKNEVVDLVVAMLAETSVVPPIQEPLPTAVACPGGRIHIPAGSEFSVCGWPWRERGGRALERDEVIPARLSSEAVELWCRRCV